MYSHPLVSTLEVDPRNNRIKIYQISNKNFHQEMMDLKSLARQKRCNKLIFYVKEEEIDSVLAYDCKQEGIIKGFFNGRDAYIYSLFFESPQNDPVITQEEEKVMNIVKDYKSKKIRSLNEDYIIRRATTKDAPKMAELYDAVFSSYPTAMNEPQYIAFMMHNNVHFVVTEYQQRIVSACSASVLPDFNCAEMTDCATLPEYRKENLLSYQYSLVIEKMREKGIQTLFCYARTLSVGMNIVNAKHNFTYGGCMIQNSNICEKHNNININKYLENMNIWYKQI